MYLILSLIIFLSYVAFHKKRTNGMPPGPFPLPIIGNLHQLGKSPYKSLKSFSDKYGGLTTIFLGSVPTVLISEPNILREIIIKNNDSIIDRYISDSGLIIGGERNLLFSKGSFWIKYRKIFSSAMTNARKFNIASRIEQQAISLNNYFGTYANSKQAINPHDYIRRYSLNGVIDYSFSDSVEYESDTHHIVIRAAEIMEEILATGNPHDYLPFLKPFYTKKRNTLAMAVGQVWDYCNDAITVHRKTLDHEKPRDLLDLILMEIEKSEEKQFYDDDSLSKCLTDLIVAGHETVAITLGWMILFLSNHQDVQQKVYDELINVVGKGNLPALAHRKDTSYLNACIQETMRIRTAAPLALPRIASEDIKVGGYTIPKGTQVMMSVYGMASDERYWKDPHIFNPERWLSSSHSTENGGGGVVGNSSQSEVFIPFGVGPRMCVGMGVAKDELYYCASQMFMNFKWSPVNDKPIDDEGVARIALEYKEYQVVLERRK
ncbi:hypothetical protein ACTFIW_011288 [Dictyostelium discoideum]